MPDNIPSTTLETLRIWQQNMRKSYAAHHELLTVAHKSQFEVIAIQEPGLNFLHLTRANAEWTVIYPERHDTHPDDT